MMAPLRLKLRFGTSMEIPTRPFLFLSRVIGSRPEKKRADILSTLSTRASITMYGNGLSPNRSCRNGCSRNIANVLGNPPPPLKTPVMSTSQPSATNPETTGPSESDQTPGPPRDTTSRPHDRHELSVATGRFSFCHSMLHKSALHRTEIRSAPLKSFAVEQLSGELRFSC